MSYEIIVRKNGNVLATRDVTDAEAASLADTIKDVDAWITHVATGWIGRKIIHSRDRLINRYAPILESDVKVATVPSDRDELAALIVARDDYRTRAEREPD